ncbi:MAG: hypothetical protein KDN22_13500 [Verrucomicrobiae bacterium]|nr:hypothetical protein [Verrucomicrobiae bacterium]
MNACEHFVDELVKLVPGTGLKQRLRAAAILIATVKSHLDYGVRSRELDVTGFRKELIQYDQRGQAIRHMRTHAALMLLGPVGWLPSWGLHLIDWLQSRKGRAESLTEMEDNKAGQQLGKLMIRGFKGQLSREQLKVEMLRLIGE